MPSERIKIPNFEFDTKVFDFKDLRVSKEP